MLSGVVDTVKLVLMDPAKFFESAQKHSLEQAVKFYAIILLVPTILMGLLFLVLGAAASPLASLGTMGFGAAFSIGFVIVYYIMAFIGSFISAVILFISAHIFGARKGFDTKYKIIAYSGTPALLLSWIPLINIIGGLWSLYLEIKGVSVMEKVTIGKAFVIVILPIIVIFAIVFLFLFTLFAAMVPFGGMMPNY